MFLMAAPAQAQTKKQLERDKAKIEREIARLSTQLSNAKKTTKASANQINLIKKRINERNNLINNINKQMGMLDRQITKTEDSLRVVRGQIDSMKSEYAKVVRTLYGLRQNLNSTTLVLDNEAYNYSYLKLKYFNEYSRYRKHQATAIRRREVQFQDMSLDLQRQRKEKSSLLSQEKKQKDALAREQNQQQQKLQKSQQDEKSLKQQIAKKEKQKQQLQNQIQQLINAEVSKTASAATGSSSSGKGSTKNSTTEKSGGKVYSDAASADFVQNKGRLAWPVYYRSVSREYGLYTHSSGGQNRNYGIDLNCAAGATVSAVFNGTVARVFTAPNGSKGVIIRHGSYMTVYAGLGTVSVSQGTKVTTRQAIGTVYSSGEETSEFSFQVWCGHDSLNPRHWLK
jgi:septal ring factor EnvC (AmiA/AmiB activator)